MAEKQPQIVIKKITVVAGGAHGGAWKVAFADFMTAMMAFFLVMWLLATQSEQQKKAISDYFSTPSIIEYQFSNFGAELTLEKLFLDLVNEPLSAFQTFVTPMDRTPNIMNMGMKKVVIAHMANELGSVATNVSVTADQVMFEIPDDQLFVRGTAEPSEQFVSVMERVKGITTGLEDSEVVVSSIVYEKSVPGGERAAGKVSQSRLDLIEAKIQHSLESDSVDVKGRAFIRPGDLRSTDKKTSGGFIRLEIKQKQVLPDGRKPKPLVDSAFSGKESSKKSVYDNFVKKVSNRKEKSR